jgi:hypothetical protein
MVWCKYSRQADRTEVAQVSRDSLVYISYLLRLWQVGSAENVVWRASVESAHTGERKGFANLRDVCSFLEQEMQRVGRNEVGAQADEGGGEDRG